VATKLVGLRKFVKNDLMAIRFLFLFSLGNLVATKSLNETKKKNRIWWPQDFQVKKKHDLVASRLTFTV
jgi:hypothetical protein